MGWAGLQASAGDLQHPTVAPTLAGGGLRQLQTDRFNVGWAFPKRRVQQLAGHTLLG